VLWLCAFRGGPGHDHRRGADLRLSKALFFCCILAAQQHRKADNIDARNPAVTLLQKLLLLAAAVVAPAVQAAGVTATDQQLKAVFVFHFSQFVDWPPTAYTADTEPFVIAVLGNDTFATLLEEVVRGEHVNKHPIQVRKVSNVEAAGPIHILFVDRSERARLEQVVELVRNRNTLIVSDLDGATQRGAMIQLTNVNQRIGLRINVDSARAARLIVRSNLLRLAEVVRNGTPQ
jgi:hypothetical protein